MLTRLNHEPLCEAQTTIRAQDRYRCDMPMRLIALRNVLFPDMPMNHRTDRYEPNTHIFARIYPTILPSSSAT